MDIETFRAYNLSLKGTTEGMKWDHLCFMIAEKLFVIIDLELGSFSLKCDPEDFDALVGRAGIQQAPHMAKRQWIKVNGLEVMPDEELKMRIQTSRALIMAKLSKKLQALYV